MNIEDFLEELLESYPNIPYAPKHPRHGYATGGGVSKNVTWQGRLLLKATNPPTTHCVGATFEFISDVLKHFGHEPHIPPSVMLDLRNRTMLDKKRLEKLGYNMHPHSENWGGCATALIEYGWATKVEDIQEVEVGDVCQLWNYRDDSKQKRVWGHSMVLTGEIDEIEDDDGTWRDVVLSRGATEKHGFRDDFHYITPKPWYREFYIARFKPDWLTTHKKPAP